MSRPLFRVRVSGPAARFQPMAVVPGQMLLDRWNASDALLGKWLGRFVAKADWHDDAFRFFVRNEEGQPLAGILCKPVTRDDLRGPLKREFSRLLDRLRKIKPGSANEKALYDFVSRGLLDPQPGAGFTALNCQFFKYRDVEGRPRLVWCYGFEPTAQRGDAWPLICPDPDCAMLQMRHPGMENKCVCCGAPLPVAERPKRTGGLVLTLLLLLLAGAVGGYLLWPSATVAGRVVRKSDGRPIADAVVHVEGLPQQATTDANGAFQLLGLPAGTRLVVAKAPGYQDAQSELSISGTKENSIELALEDGAKLAGRVVYRSGDEQVPVANAQVAVAGSSGLPITTDAEGRFELTGLTPGESTITITAAGFRDQTAKREAASEAGKPLDIFLTGTRKLSGQIVFEADPKIPIAQAEISPDGFDGEPILSDSEGKFNLDCLPPGEAKLKVVAAGFAAQSLPIKPSEAEVVVPLAGDAVLTGEVQRADTKAPVADAEVQIPGTPFTARTNGQGAFRLEGVRSGPARLTVQAPGLVGVVTQNLAAKQTTAVKILLAGGLTATGRVIDAASQEPILGATVSIADSNITARTDAQGKYTLAGLAEGTITLTISATGFLPAQADVASAPGNTKFADIDLHRAASLEGRVISAKDQKPVKDAEVEFGEAKTKTDARGEFKLAPLPTGKGKLVISAPEHFPLRLAPELSPGEQTLNELTLAVLARVRGTVLSAFDQMPLPGAVVAIAETGEKVTTNAEGSYEIALAPAGQVFMASAAPGYETKRWKQTLAAGDQNLDDILLEGNTLVKGLTLDGGEANQWVPNVKLEVVIGKHRQQLTSDSKGAFVIGKLPPGPVAVKATAPGFLDAKVLKEVQPGDATIEITLLPLVETR